LDELIGQPDELADVRFAERFRSQLAQAMSFCRIATRGIVIYRSNNIVHSLALFDVMNGDL
jgi:hypothetical protein